jgi:two-component system cell cycle response regulator DivK
MSIEQKKILIIDDDSRNIFALKAVLRAKKIECLSALSAKDGFEIIKKNNDVGVVLMDMMMPDLDGYEAIAVMKTDEVLNKIPVIAVTARAMVGDREQCIEAGAVGYVSKPVDVEELVKIIKTLI